MPGWTNRGKYANLNSWLRATGTPAACYVALLTAASAPGPDTNLMSDHTELGAGNGYVAGGIIIARTAVGFDSLVEDDVNDRAEIQVKDITWTAVGGPIPAAGAGATYAVLTDDAGVVANREIYHYWTLAGAPITLLVGESLTLQDLEMRETE